MIKKSQQKMLNGVNEKIISVLLKDGRTSYKKLGNVIGYTVMGTKHRVQKMLSEGLLRVSTEINVEKMSLQMALILLEFESRETVGECLKRFEKCPRIVNMFTLFAGYNLAAMVIAENKETLESESIEKCSLRCQKGVRRTEFYPVGTILFSPFMRIRLDLVTRNMEKAPCGVKCDVCERYRADKCVGCPATRHYKGWL